MTSKYLQTIRRTVEWTERNWDRIVNEVDLQGHYKALYFALSVGDMPKAAKFREIICNKFLRSDGDFRQDEDCKGFKLFPCLPPNRYIYPNGWIVVGLQRLGLYGHAAKGMDFMLRFQDENTGGFFHSFNPATKEIDNSSVCCSCTSSAGLACLACGRTENALKAGDFLLKLLELQPEPEKYFFSCMNPDGTLYTDVFRSENQWDPKGRKQKCLSAVGDGLNELTWLIGKPSKFLAKLYAATGEKKYLEGAIKAFDFFHHLDKNAWKNYASCKTMWSAAELYRLTGERRFAETAMKIADFFCESQTPSGVWLHSLWYKSEEEQPLSMTMDIMFEFGSELSDLVFDLES